jgi:hypothetical protein
MKKLIGLTLAAALAVSCAVPAFAAQESAQQPKIVVSMSTIEDVMSDYNLGIRTVVNNLKLAKDSYENYKDTEQEDYYENQYDIAQEQYDEKVQQQVLSAKQQYITFCADNAQLAEDRSQLDSLQKKLSLSKAELEKGYIGRKDYDDAADQAAQAQNTLTAQDAKVTQGKKDLETTLNLPSGVPVEFQPLSDPDFGEIPQIDYSKDAVVMYNKNAEIKSAGLNYDYVRDSFTSTSWQIDNARIQLEQTADAQKSRFRQLYDTLMNSYRTYLQDSAKLQRQESDVQTQQRMRQLGYVSAQSADDAQLQLQTARSSLAAEAGSLYSDYLSYLHMKNGYSLAG